MALIEKNILMKIFLAIILLVSVGRVNAQLPIKSFFSNGSEYVYFVNDTAINYRLITSNMGALGIRHKGNGIYKINSGSLIIQTLNQESNRDYDKILAIIDTSEFANKTNKIDTYEIVYLSDSRIELIGPVTNDFEKLNKKRFRRGFLNWPWRWSFKKQHWYDPRSRNLTLQDN